MVQVAIMRETLSVLEERLDHPTARGLAIAVSRALREGHLVPGSRLPPIRMVATQLGLSPNTVSAAWALLVRSGAIHTDGRRGTTISEQITGPLRYRKALERQTTFEWDLATGVPDPALLPELGPILRTLDTPTTMLGSYLDEPVLPELVDVLRADWPYDAEDFTLVNGAMDALNLAANSFVKFGDRVVVEDPCFAPLLDLLESLGAEVVGVPIQKDGMDPVALAEAVRHPVAAVFLQPRAQNPTGISMSRERASQLAEILRAAGPIVIEDDSSGGVVEDATPMSLGQWLPEQTLHIHSFSKSHGPDLRLAAVSGPVEFISEIAGRRQLAQGWTSRLLQRLLLRLITDEVAVKQVVHARTEYRRRRQAVVKALQEQDIAVVGEDGINIWLPVNDETAAVIRLASQGIGVTPGAPFCVNPGDRDHIRVTVGLLPDRHAEVADFLASAARTKAWRGP